MDTTSMTVLVGNVVLEHNRVVMSCDSAEWFPTGLFNSFGNVVVVSAAAQVTGDRMEYNGNTSMAKVRGRVVYLRDSSSTLRTSGIDFNTKDEICFFQNEGTIKDTAQLLEARQGYYYSKRKEFEFAGRVQSETNDYLLQSDSMMYNTDTKLFTFYDNTHIWAKDRDGYLYCDRGTYDSENDRLFFTHNSYIMSRTQEVFADSIYYENKSGKGKLYSNVQVVDTSQRSIAMSDFADFDMNSQDFVMRKNPSILIYDQDNDTVFMRADTLLSFNVPIAAVQADTSTAPEDENSPDPSTAQLPDGMSAIKSKLAGRNEHQDLTDRNRTIMLSGKDISKANSGDKSDSSGAVDTVAVSGVKPAVDSLTAGVSDNSPTRDSATLGVSVAKPARDSAASDVSYSSQNIDSLRVDENDFLLKSGDSATLSRDSSSDSTTQAAIVADSSSKSALLKAVAVDSAAIAVRADSVAVDSTYRQIFGIGNVKIFRRDFQAKCDSAYFNTLDSIWKMHKSPVIWDSARMQLFSDSVRIYVVNSAPDRAEFESNAMIIIPEGDPDSTSWFNQIKGRNMSARFQDKELRSLYVAGNVHTLFFSLSDMMMNDTEAASMRINFTQRKVRRVVYFTDVKVANNPLFIVPEESTKLAGFAWQERLRPKSRDEVLGRLLRMSARCEKELLSRPDFPITVRIDAIERAMQQEIKDKK